MHPGRVQCGERLLVLLEREELEHGLGDLVADAVDGQQLGVGRSAQTLERAEVRGEVLRRGLPDVADADAVEKARQRRLAARVDLLQQVLRAALAPAVELEQLLLFAAQGEDVLDRVDQLRLDELLDLLGAEALDVERTAAGEVHDAPDQLRVAVDVVAVEELALWLQRVCADRARVGRRCGLRLGAPLLFEDAHDLGDDVAGSLDLDDVALAHVALGQQRPVVQRGVAHGDAGELGGLQVRDRRDRAGAADLRADPLDARAGEARLELVGERPPRRARGAAELRLQGDVVDLGDRAVHLVRELVAAGLEVVVVGVQRREIASRHGGFGDGEAPRRQLFAKRGVCRDFDALDVTDGEGEEVQRPPLDHSWVEQLERARDGVARVAERAFAAGLFALLQRREPTLGHDDLAADLDARGEGAVARQLGRKVADGAQVASQVLAGLPVPARQPAHQHAVLVEQVGADAVELGFTAPGQLGVVRELQELAGTGDERVDVFGLHQRLEAAHLDQVRLRLERAAALQRRSDALGRGVLGHQRRMGLLELAQLDEQLVVLGVGEVTLAVVVVLVVGRADAAPEFVEFFSRRHRGRW